VRIGASGLHACVPTSAFEAPWPDGVPLQIHIMDAGEWGKEDLVAARDLVDEIENAELFLYLGDGQNRVSSRKSSARRRRG
jgi:hypothetical protein